MPNSSPSPLNASRGPAQSSSEASLEEAFAWVEEGDAESLKKALESHPQWGRARNIDGETLLMQAAACGDEACVEMLIPLSEPKAYNKGFHALAMAAARGHAGCVTQLLPVSDANALCSVLGLARPEEQDFSALMLAAVEGHLDCIEALIPHSDAGLRTRKGFTALGFAVESKHLECAQALLEVSEARLPVCREEFASHEAVSPLIRAAGNGDLEMVRLLLPHSDANQLDSDRKTALMVALSRGEKDCAWALLKVSPLERVSLLGDTALALAMECERMQRINTRFTPGERIEEKASLVAAIAAASPFCLNHPDATGKQPLQRAIEADLWLCADALLVAMDSPSLLQETLDKHPTQAWPQSRAIFERKALSELLQGESSEKGHSEGGRGEEIRHGKGGHGKSRQRAGHETGVERPVETAFSGAPHCVAKMPATTGRRKGPGRRL